MTSAASALRGILHPERVAVIGASDDAAKFGGRVMRYLVQHGYAGAILPVNRGAREVLGLKAYPSIGDAPGPVDVSLLAVPAAHLPRALEECGAAGVRCCVIVTSDFAEAGPEGAARQAELVQIARRHGMRLIGPNCLGLINPRLKLALTSSVALAAEPMPCGPIGLVSQSGSLMASLISHAQDLGTGFTAAVTVGNQADLEICDFLDYFIDDPDTRAICAYVEGLKDGRRFLAVAGRARDARKPLLVVKAGITPAGAASVQSHTASLAGSHAVFEAACREQAVCLIDDPESMIQCAAFLARFGAPSSPGVAAISPSGGTISVATDRMIASGLALARLAPATEVLLREWFPPSRPLNPLDTGGLALEKSMGGAMAAYEALAADPGVGVVLIAVATTPELDEKVARWGEAALRLGKPTVMLLVPGSLVDGTRARLRALGCPHVNRLDDALRVLRVATGYRLALDTRHDPGAPPTWCAALAADAAALPDGRLTEMEAKALLRRAGIATTMDLPAATADDAVSAAESVAYPVVLKGLCRDVVHKSDIGAVRVGLCDARAVRTAFDEIAASIARHTAGARFEGCVVQNHVGDGLEFIVGARWDAQFGSVVMVGAGGVLVELIGDVALAIAPVARSRAAEMVASLRARRLLDGLRGAPRADHDALLDAVVNVSWLAATLGPRLAELDVNPVTVRRAGAVALDARATLVTPGNIA